jgi:hypothetical protein
VTGGAAMQPPCNRYSHRGVWLRGVSGADPRRGHGEMFYSVVMWVCRASSAASFAAFSPNPTPMT